MASPAWADRSAIESLAPSPHITTVLPESINILTISAFWLGDTRANTFVRSKSNFPSALSISYTSPVMHRMAFASPASESSLMSESVSASRYSMSFVFSSITPITTREVAPIIPTVRATALPVNTLSPVSIATSIPAPFSSDTHFSESGLTSFRNNNNPTNPSSFSTCSRTISPGAPPASTGGISFIATPRMKQPSCAYIPTACFISALTSVHFGASASNDPLHIPNRCPLAFWMTIALIVIVSWLNGNRRSTSHTFPAGSVGARRSPPNFHPSRVAVSTIRSSTWWPTSSPLHRLTVWASAMHADISAVTGLDLSAHSVRRIDEAGTTPLNSSPDFVIVPVLSRRTISVFPAIVSRWRSLQ